MKTNNNNKKINRTYTYTKTRKCTNCGKLFYPTRDRRSAQAMCCSVECGKKRMGKKEWVNGHPKGMLGKKHTDETKLKMSLAYKAAWENPKSKLNSDENRQRISDLNVVRHASGQFYKQPENTPSRGEKGWWQHGEKKYYMRSKWEMNYAWYLEWLKKKGEIADWEYEVDTFWFESIRRGVRSYKPDFKVFIKNDLYEYHEVKGWMDAKSQTKLKRMAKYYPDIKVIVIAKDEYNAIKKWARLIPGWE